MHNQTVGHALDSPGLDLMATASNNYRPTINVKKTKHMIISKQNIQDTCIRACNVLLEIVEKIKYLGCMRREDWDHS